MTSTRNTTGGGNTAIGANALLSSTFGIENTATGANALLSNTIGINNTATGFHALNDNTTGGFNTANGFGALSSNTTGGGNAALGAGALQNNTANYNTAVGVTALPNSTTGTGNAAFGVNAGIAVTTASNVICIGHDGQNVSNSCYIGQIFGATSPGGTAVFINSDGKLGTVISSRRFKEEIKPMDQTSEAILSLKPVTFHYKKGIDPQGIPQFGLVAEEVEEINPDLVVRDKEGKVNTVRYDAVNAMLLNEFLKEHRTVEEQKATIAELRKEMETVLTRLKEHDSRIQKVSAQIEMSKPSPQVVGNQR